MVVKNLCNRERDKDTDQISRSSLMANIHINSQDVVTTPGDGAGSPTAQGTSTGCSAHTNSTSVVSITSLHFHIRALYAVVGCLTVVLVSSLALCYLEINSLRSDLSRSLTAEDLVNFKFPAPSVFNDAYRMPYISPEDELSLGGFLEGGEFPEESGSNGRPRRQARPHEGSGSADEWLWMSSFARVPVVALQSYCREAQLYCAAAGKPGPPGSVGPKGDSGDKGEKGDPADESSVAASLANIEAVRGLPGLPGENGADGLPGPMGPKGEMGPPGIQGNNGINGYPGPEGSPGQKGAAGPPGLDGPPGLNGAKGDRGAMGPQGERGISGLPGVPGLKGLQGNVGQTGLDGLPGLPGNKGEPGYCQEGCDERERTRTYTDVPKPPPTFPPRVKECSIDVVGMPVFQHDSTTKKGTWMKDLKHGALSKIWVTYQQEGTSVFEYSSMGNLKSGESAREIILSDLPYYGTGHLVYNGHLYYHWAGMPKIVRFDLATAQATTARTIPDMIYKSSPALKGQGFLFESQTMFVSFNVDQNGLWLIYGSEKHEKITVALLDIENLDIINSVTINFELGTKGGAFIACGKLYTLKHYNRQRSFLEDEYDLWKGQTRGIRLTFINPFAETYMLSFDHNNNQIYLWDGGRMLSLPLLLKSN